MDNTIKLIAHRGNLNGRQPDHENHPDYLHDAISAGFDVEVDVWRIGDVFMLGHDKPRHVVDEAFLQRKASRMWVHAKDLQALRYFAENEQFNVFCHSHDPRTLTTKGFVWTSSAEQDYDERSILLHLAEGSLPVGRFAGLCTNYPKHYAELLKGS